MIMYLTCSANRESIRHDSEHQQVKGAVLVQWKV